MEDISALQKKLAEYEQLNSTLLLQNEELRDFVDNASIPLHWVNSEGIITWANQAELEMLGYSAEEFIGKPIQNFHTESANINEIFSKLKDNQTLINYPATLKCKDGSVKHVLINSNVYRKDGKFVHTRCFTRDVSPVVAENTKKDTILSALEHRESQLQMAIELTNLGTWDWDPITDELTWSNQCKNIYGFPIDKEPTFKHFSNLIHPDDHDRVQSAVQNALDSEDGTYEITNRIIRYDDQTIRWIKVRGKVYFNADRQAERFIGTVVDITDSRHIQDKILSTERLFKSIAVNIPNTLVIVIDKNHRFITIEGDLMEKMGYNSADYTGKHPTEVAPPERYEASKHLYERVLEGEKFSVERKGATGGDYMVHFVPLKNDDQEIEAGLIIAMDITEIKEAQEKSAKLAAIIESTDDAIVSKTLEGIITSWNDSAQRTFGYTADEMIGQPILKLIPLDRQQEEVHILSRLRKGERVEHFETKRLKKDGNLLDVSLTVSPVKDKNGNIIGVSKIARDITERKQEEQRKNDFVAIVSHELKTPLTSITGYIQLLLSKAKKEDNEQILNILTRTEIQAKKMAAMIQDFLDLAKMEEGKIQLNLTKFGLLTLFEEILTDPQFKSTKHDIEINMDQHISLVADRDKIGQVLINLLSNAIKYSPQGGKIRLGSEIEDKNVRIYVSDQGLGIALSDQKRLFDRFYRVNDDRVKSVSGFGIGLYFVSEILRYHNSNIEVTSKEGVGSTFYFSLALGE
jgi:PAS domain S-box-containing protein